MFYGVRKLKTAEPYCKGTEFSWRTDRQKTLWVRGGFLLGTRNVEVEESDIDSLTWEKKNSNTTFSYLDQSSSPFPKSSRPYIIF